MNNAFVLALAVALGAPGCDRQDPAQRTASVTRATASEIEGAAEPFAARESLYQLAVPLTDQDGKAIGLDVARGHPVVIAMFYGTCRSTCPLIVRDVKALEAQLSPAEQRDLRVLLVSFDADRDTPAAMRHLAEKHGVDGARWRFAAAPEPGARSLAALLGVQYRRLPEGEFSHNAVLALLDRNGVMALRIEGLGQPTKMLVEKLRALPGALSTESDQVHK
jgi:protein SCO1